MTDFINNTAENRFEYHVEDHVSSATYRQKDADLYIDFVFSPPALRGTGAASTLMQHIKTYADQKSLNIIPICGYAVHWINKNT